MLVDHCGRSFKKDGGKSLMGILMEANNRYRGFLIGKEQDLTLTNSKKKLIKIGTLDQWDISLLSRILAHGNWGQLTKPMKKENKQILSLREIRNKVLHDSSLLRESYETASEFDTIWNQICGILKSFGEKEEDLDEMKVRDWSKRVPQEVLDKVKEYRDKGNKEHVNKRYREAIELYSEGIALVDAPDEERAFLYSNRSASYLALNELDMVRKALDDAKESCRLHPSWYKGHYRKGMCYHRQGSYEKAVKAFNAALATKPNDDSLRKAKDKSLDLLNKQKRIEHMDSTYTQSVPEFYERIATRSGKNWGMDSSLSLLDQIIAMGDPLGSGDCMMGHQYVIGNGRPQNYQEAAKCFNNCRKKKSGWAEGAYNLGLLTSQGRGVIKDFREAIRLYEEAACLPPMSTQSKVSIRNLGVAEAQNALGNAYLDGTGVEKDMHKAVEYLLKSAHNQCSAAMNTLGAIHMKGEGVPQDSAKAVQWYKQACDVGDAGLPMWNLGMCYAQGKGVSTDIDQAVKYFRMSLETGYESAREELEKYEKIQRNPLQKEAFQMISDHLPTPTTEPKPFSASMGERYPLEQLQEHDDSAFVNKMLISKGYCLAISHFLVRVPRTEKEQMDMIHGLANAYRVCELPVQIPMQNIASIIRLAEEFYQEGIEDAAVVYGFLKGCTEFDWAEQFYAECHNKWDQSPYFLHRLAEINCYCKHYSRATANFTRFLQMVPNDVEALYGRAEARRIDGDMAGATQDYLEFLKLSDSKHRKRPEAYYALGVCSLPATLRRPSEVEMQKMAHYYQLGQEAEKDMIPCFFPLTGTSKQVMTNILMSIGKLPQEVKVPVPSASSAPSASTTKSKDRLNDLRRQHKIQHHNEQVAKVGRMLAEPGSNVKHVPMATPRIKQVAGDIFDRKIFLDEMNPSQERIYEGRVLKGILFGNPLLMTSIQLFIEDDHGDMLDIAFYDHKFTPKNMKQIREYYYGKKIAIVNPFHRLSVDGSRRIRVDDAMSVVFLPSKHQAFCGHCCETDQDKPVKFMCSKCHVVRYCSKECQIADWQLGHKLACPFTK
eukprot:TRINITY_DN2665_c0_g1_i5.p1 TRINITY_DN2665_c0_g1~~TRINITY_DN2665_c0_g1_i5.p1  ORF type:complete len:1055 (+),score=152.45 TRINITY_DN2665_c0_g1_i5:86-3250(+)